MRRRVREDDNNPFRQSPGDGQERLWLRQSATFTVNGQTRTVEIALPVRPGTAPDEVEALLDEADAGMRRLARRLDAHVAEATGALLSADASQASAAQSAAQHATHGAPTPPARTIAEAPHAAPSPASPMTPAPVASQSSPAPQPSSARPATAPAPAGSRPAPATTARPAPADQPTARTQPETPQPATRPAAPMQSTRVDSRAPAAPTASEPAAPPMPPVSADGPELSRAEFLAAANALGYNPKQAMDKLNVRSLNGLNLREALAVLQRQSLRGDAAPAPASSEAPRPKATDTTTAAMGNARSAGQPTTPTNGARPAAAPTPAAPQTPTPRPAYGFDEEDEADITFDLSDEPPDDFGVLYPEQPAPTPANAYAPNGASGGAPYAYDDLDDLDELDDLDDLDNLAPLSATDAFALDTPSIAETGGAADEASAGDNGQASVRSIIARLRTARGGGVPAQQQRTAYRNIVIAQLGEEMASALVRGVWRITPERLGPEQLDAINQWGKEDAFADEVVLALAALEDERATAQSAAPAAPAAQPTRPAPRSATRSTSARTGAQRQGEDAGAPPPTPSSRARAPRA